jgi:uncharacterized protein
MSRKDNNVPVSDLKRLRVLGRCFVYNTRTARHAELDGKTWHMVGSMLRQKKTIASEIGDLPELADVMETLPQSSAAQPLGPKNLILQVSHACNLRCHYCSADFGRYGGDFRQMSSLTAGRAVDFLFDNSPSNELAVTYFGGEPLLNLETVFASVRHAQDRAAKEGRLLPLHLVTNGVLLNPQTLFRLDELGFSLTVSLDGARRCHDRSRPFADGGSSYRATSRSLEIAAKLPIGRRITVRGTFTRETSAFFPNVRFLAGCGFSRNIAYEPVFLPSSHPLSLRRRDLPAVKRAYIDLARYYVKRWRSDDPFCLWDFDDAITQLACAKPRVTRCGSGVTTLAVTAEEEIYACHMSTGIAGAKLGDLQGGMIEEHCRPWRERYLEGRKGCADCWLRALCGGGCNTHALFYNRALGLPYRLECELIEHRYRLAMWILSQVPGLKKEISDRCAGEDSGSGHLLLSPLWSCRDAEAK